MSRTYRLVLDDEQNARGYAVDLPAELLREAGVFPGERLIGWVYRGRRGAVINLRRDDSHNIESFDMADTTSDLIGRFKSR